MVTNGNLDIFMVDIIVDRNLPKHKKPKLANTIDGVEFSSPDFGGMISRSIGNMIPNDPHLDYLEYQYSNCPTLLMKFKIWLYKSLYSSSHKIKNPNTKNKITLEELKTFFDEVKVGVCKLNKKNIDEVLNNYDNVLNNAKNNNQIALIEQIVDFAEVLKYELLLSTTQFNQFVNDGDIVKFHDKASVHGKYKTGLHLTYIKNFTKTIPFEITELKLKADELKVFDNYVILHYDYTGKTIVDTKKEKERKKDPILFGLIKDSKKLYYIGDWIDEYCDLTLDVLIKTIGKTKVDEINKSGLIQDIKNI
jgi:hypothetical protein